MLDTFYMCLNGNGLQESAQDFRRRSVAQASPPASCGGVSPPAVVVLQWRIWMSPCKAM